MKKGIRVYSNERGLRRLKVGIALEDYKVKYPSAIKVRVPSLKTLEKWGYDGISKTPCGCTVEQDGYCKHNRPSWFLILGYI